MIHSIIAAWNPFAIPVSERPLSFMFWYATGFILMLTSGIILPKFRDMRLYDNGRVFEHLAITTVAALLNPLVITGTVLFYVVYGIVWLFSEFYGTEEAVTRRSNRQARRRGQQQAREAALRAGAERSINAQVTETRR